jgi:hypothetical protein
VHTIDTLSRYGTGGNRSLEDRDTQSALRWVIYRHEAGTSLSRPPGFGPPADLFMGGIYEVRIHLIRNPPAPTSVSTKSVLLCLSRRSPPGARPPPHPPSSHRRKAPLHCRLQPRYRTHSHLAAHSSSYGPCRPIPALTVLGDCVPGTSASQRRM